MNLNNFGNKLRLAKTAKSKENEAKLNFISIITQLEACWIRTNFLHTKLNVDFWNYEEHFYHIIEDLIYTQYESWKADLIFWYVYDRKDTDGNILALEITEGDKPPKKYKLKTPEELWKLLEKIDKIENKGKNNE